MHALAKGALLLGLILWASEGRAQSAENLPWKECPCVGDLGNAIVNIPDGMLFLDWVSVPRFLERIQNPADGDERGVVLGQSESGEGWFVIFSFRDTGYVSDNERDSLNPDEILNSIREGTNAANKEREQRGWPRLDVTGWHSRPFYDQTSNNLTWAILGSGSDGAVVNHSVRLLGRRGVMSADLVLGPETLPEAMPAFDQVVRGFDFKPGERYREFTRGDRVAEIGLTALVAGGAGAAVAKSGMLKQLWKLLVFGVLALVALAKRLFAAVLGGRPQSEASGSGN